MLVSGLKIRILPGRKQSACFQTSQLHFSFHLPVAVVFSSHFQAKSVVEKETIAGVLPTGTSSSRRSLTSKVLQRITAPLWLRITTFTRKIHIAHLQKHPRFLTDQYGAGKISARFITLQTLSRTSEGLTFPTTVTFLLSSSTLKDTTPARACTVAVR
jgi:hypothetical protein